MKKDNFWYNCSDIIEKMTNGKLNFIFNGYIENDKFTFDKNSKKTISISKDEYKRIIEENE